MRTLQLDKALALSHLRATPTVVSAALGLLSAVAHILFVRPTPVNWDAVQFELALTHFDLHSHQPHPPGYILYVLAGRVLNLFVGQPGLALSCLSVLATAVAVPLVYLLALHIFEEASVALGSALLLLGSPLALYYGSVGLTYAPELALTLGVAALSWRARETASWQLAAFLGLALGLLGGVRQTSLLLLLPLALWGVWGRERKVRAAFALALSITCVAWAIPLLVLSGSPAAYLRENALMAEVVYRHTSLLGAGPGGVTQNLVFEALGLGVGLAFAAIPLGLWLSRTLRFSLAPQVRAFLLLWAIPPLVFYALTHVGQHGYMLAVLPPFLILSALCIRVLAQRVRSAGHQPWTASVCLVLALASAGYFTFGHGPVTASSIAANDEHWKAVKAWLAGHDPQSTALVTTLEWGGPFRLAGYLLPQFHSYAAGERRNDNTYGWRYSAYGGRSDYALPNPPASPYLPLPEGTRTVVALDEEIAARIDPRANLQRVSLADGSALYILSGPGDIGGLNIERGRIAPIYKGER
jgi:hypothetical protein